LPVSLALHVATSHSLLIRTLYSNAFESTEYSEGMPQRCKQASADMEVCESVDDKAAGCTGGREWLPHSYNPNVLSWAYQLDC